MTATTLVKEKGLTPSPFSLSLETELTWETMSSKETMIKNGVIGCSIETKALIHDLSVVGVIGSVQCSRLYWNMDKEKKHWKKSIELRYIKKHQLIRGKNSIPIYTLGATGFFIAGKDPEHEANRWKQFKKHDVLQRLAFFQFYTQLKEQTPTIYLEPAEAPYICKINRNGKAFSVLVVRGNENNINNFFRYEIEKMPERILIIVESLNHLNPIQNAIKPFLNRIRVTTDHDFKESFENMFYLFKDNTWQKELH